MVGQRGVFDKARWIAAGAGALYLLAVWNRGAPPPLGAESVPDVVLPAPIQVVLYAGDRYLAANVESVRAAASGLPLQGHEGSFRLRTHRAVSRLNPCHEDNYWLGNAALSWGGAVNDGFELLGRATQCRFWDEFPPFLYGFNQKFFRRDVALARQAFEMAAERSVENAAAMRNIAIMLTVNAEKDARVALEMLKRERDAARDQNLRAMLDQRVGRLAGLVSLRQAKVAYEARFGKSLEHPNQLLQSGLINAFPLDPLGLGYEFRDGEFELKQVKFQGLN